MVQFMTEPFQIGQEISVTGKWVPKTPGGLFRKSADSEEMLKEWEGIHSSAKADSGILSTEINHAVGADAVLFQMFLETLMPLFTILKLRRPSTCWH
jgi:hypothetical protein